MIRVIGINNQNLQLLLYLKKKKKKERHQAKQMHNLLAFICESYFFVICCKYRVLESRNQ